MSKNKYTITQEIVLPSKGHLNPEIPDGIVTQRCMMVSDQKYLSGSSVVKGNKMNRLLQDTTVAPDGFDVTKLTLPDILFMSLKLRCLSYGNSMKFITVCPICGQKTEVTLDLSTLEVKDLPDDYEESLKIKLPIAGDTVLTRILTVQDFEDISDDLKSARKRLKDDEAVINLEYEYRIAKMIKKVILKTPTDDGDKELTFPTDIQQYVSELPDLDATAIISTVDNIQYGVTPTAEAICTECGREITVPVRFTGDFFRPKYDRTSSYVIK